MYTSNASNLESALAPSAPPRPADGILQVAWRSRLVVLVVTIASINAGVLYIHRTPPTYVATGQLVVDRAPTGGNGLDSNINDQYLATQCLVIKSAPLLTEVLADPAISSLGIFASSPIPVLDFQRLLSVESQRKEDVLNVSFSAHTPDDAAAVVNALMDAYCHKQDEHVKATAGGGLEALNRDRDRSATERLARQTTLLDFRRNHPQLSMEDDRGGNIITDQLVALSDARTAAQLDTARAKTAYDDNHTTPVEQRWLAAKAHEEFIEASYQRQVAAAVSLNVAKGQYEQLEADYKRTADAFAATDEQVRRYQLAGAMPSSRLTILERAHLPTSSTWPDPIRIIVLATVVGGVLGTIFALLLDLKGRGKLKFVDDVGSTLGIPVLGTVPQFRPAVGLIMGFIRSIRRGRSPEFDTNPIVAEAVRQVRTAITLGKGSENRRVLLVTSPMPGDGKSMLISNLAIALAKSGKRVLLVDGDLRLPVLHKIFDMGERPGLADFLSSQANMEDVIYRTTTKSLSIMPCGTVPSNPSELLEDPSLGSLLQRTTEQFDYVLVDSPPVGSAADARVISTQCDGTLMVVRCDRSTRKHSQAARDGLLSVGARVLGVIVNGVRRDDDRYSQYGGYGYVPAVANTALDAAPSQEPLPLESRSAVPAITMAKHIA